MRSTVNREASSIVLRAIRTHLTAIEDGIRSYHSDASKFEDIDESIRRTRIAKCATSIIGSATLSRFLSFQEDVLESVVIDGCALDDEVLSLLTEMLSATDSYVDAQESSPDGTDALDSSRERLIASLKAYRRYRDLPDSDDERAISDLFRGARTTAVDGTYADGPHVDGHQPNATFADASFAEIDETPPSDTVEKDEIAPELLEVFQEEAEDHINQIYAGLSELDKDQGNRDHLQRVRRAAHTFKGAAGAVGLRTLSKLSHRMEDVLDQLYDGNAELTRDHLSLLLETTDVLQDCLNDPDSNSAEKIPQLYAAYDTLTGEGDATVPPGQAATAEATPVAENTNEATEQNKAKASQPRTVRVPSQRLDEVRNVVSELIINRTSLEQSMEKLVTCVDELQPVLDRMRAVCHQLETNYEVPALWKTSAHGPAWMSTTNGQTAWHDDREEFDELELDRYTDFHLLTRSLAETTSDTGAIGHELRTLIGDFETLLAQQTQLTGEAHTRLLEIRMVPFGSAAPRLSRVLREVADRQKKSVELVIEGEHTELDKTVLEELIDPLVHLIRNSVDHGVETADVREATGKPTTAHVYLSAAHYGTQVVIRIRDDGKGLDPEKIRAGIIEGGYLNEAEVDELSQKELFSYIFLPGFTTASHVTEVSGRGVGMDVVRSNVEKLKGSIDVESAVGVGTCFAIRLPTTLVVTRALIAMTNNETFAIPTHAVTKIRKVEPDSIVQHDRRSTIDIDGSAYDLVRFDSHLEFAPVTNPSNETLTVAIVQLGDRLVALSFDTILSTRDIVVKPLGNHLGDVRGLLGATVLGDGSVVPILDPAGLTTCPALSDSVPQLAAVPDMELRNVSVMIVDDSVSVRRALTNLMQYADWTPTTARDGVDALEKIGDLTTPPHIVLLDVEMPRMDGYELLGILRSKPEFEHTPIIMITSRAGDKHRRKAIELGATAYVVKPFQDEVLLHLMQRHIAQSQKLMA